MKSRKGYSSKKYNSRKKHTRRKKVHSRKKGIRVKTRHSRARARGRGYTNECIMPAPRHDERNHESCRAVDLKGDYGETQDKECNMYYYIHNGKYYRCRDAGRNKCNKNGRSGLKRVKCSDDSQARLDREDDSLDDELLELVEPSVPRTMNRSRQNNSNASIRTTTTTTRANRKPVTRTSLDNTIDNLSRQNDKYLERQQQLRERLKTGRSRGNVTKQMETLLARQHKMFDLQIKKNEASINNLRRMRRIK